MENLNTMLSTCKQCGRIPSIKIITKEELIIKCDCLRKTKIKIKDFLSEIQESISNNANNTEIKCTLCDYSITENLKYCIKCQSWFCPKCLYLHNKSNKNTHVKYITDYYVKAQPYCYSHKSNEVSYYCKKCKFYFCSLCLRKHIFYHDKKSGLNNESYLNNNADEFNNTLYSANYDKYSFIIYLKNFSSIRKHNSYMQKVKDFTLVSDHVDYTIDSIYNKWITLLENSITKINTLYLKHKEINNNLISLFTILINTYNTLDNIGEYNHYKNLETNFIENDFFSYNKKWEKLLPLFNEKDENSEMILTLNEISEIYKFDIKELPIFFEKNKSKFDQFCDNLEMVNIMEVPIKYKKIMTIDGLKNNIDKIVYLDGDKIAINTICGQRVQIYSKVYDEEIQGDKYVFDFNMPKVVNCLNFMQLFGGEILVYTRIIEEVGSRIEIYDFKKDENNNNEGDLNDSKNNYNSDDNNSNNDDENQRKNIDNNTKKFNHNISKNNSANLKVNNKLSRYNRYNSNKSNNTNNSNTSNITEENIIKLTTIPYAGMFNITEIFPISPSKFCVFLSQYPVDQISKVKIYQISLINNIKIVSHIYTFNLNYKLFNGNYLDQSTLLFTGLDDENFNIFHNENSMGNRVNLTLFFIDLNEILPNTDENNNKLLENAKNSGNNTENNLNLPEKITENSPKNIKFYNNNDILKACFRNFVKLNGDLNDKILLFSKTKNYCDKFVVFNTKNLQIETCFNFGIYINSIILLDNNVIIGLDCNNYEKGRQIVEIDLGKVQVEYKYSFVGSRIKLYYFHGKRFGVLNSKDNTISVYDYK